MRPPPKDAEGLLAEHDFVRRLARRLIFDPSLADDVAQETWLAALESGASNVRSPRAWLATLVRRLASRARRVANRRIADEAHAAKSEALPSTDEILEHEAARRMVVEALLALDEPYRSTIAARYFEDLPPREIAARSGVSVEAVKTRLKRGLEMLRARLDRGRGERSSWAPAVVGSMKLVPSTAATVAFALKSVLPSGVLLMAGKKIAWVSIAIVLVASVAIWRFALPPSRTAEPDPNARASSAAPAALAAETAKPIVAPNSAEASRSALEAPHEQVAKPAATANEGSVRVVLTWSDKTPAANVGVALLASGRRDPHGDRPHATSDAAGVAKFTHVPIGRADVSLDRNWRASNATVRGGEEATIEIEIPRGIDVAGRVLDIDRRPMADASIVLSAFGDDRHVFEVARSAPDGRFNVRDVNEGGSYSLSARAALRTPTKQVPIRGSVGQQLAIELFFEAAGGELDGRVISRDGRPIAGAQLLVGSDVGTRKLGRETFMVDTLLADGSHGLLPARELATSDANGEFALRGVEVGTIPIQARATGFAATQTTVEIRANQVVRADLTLDPACKLRGVVRDASGTPIENAQIALDASPFLIVGIESDADGSYLLADLPIGAFKVKATSPAHGADELEFVGEAGAELRGDFTLASGRELRGRVVANGSESRSWSIQVRAMKFDQSDFGARAATDETGRFRITNCPDVALHVEVSSSIFPDAMLDDVHAGPDELVVQLDPQLAPSIRIVGRVLDDLGNPLGADVVFLGSRFNFAPVEHSDASTGRFAVGPYPPGDWSAWAAALGFGRVTVPMHHCEPNDTWDLGDVVLERSGTVVVHASREGGGEAGELNLQLYNSTGWFTLQRKGDAWESEAVAPGHYVVLDSGSDEHTAREAWPVDVRSGEQTSISIVLRSGVRVAFALRGGRLSEKEFAGLEIHDASGAIAAILELRADTPESSRAMCLRPGHFSYVVNDSSGVRARGEFDVGATAAAEPVAVELH